MRISVVVNSRDEGAWLRETVQNLADTLPEDREIVVVDDGSVDGSADFLRRRKQPARLLRTETIGVARARNLGARKSKGRVIIFSDAHMRYAKDWWRPLLHVLDRPKAGAAAPIVASTEDTDKFGYGFTIPNPDLAPVWLKAGRGAAPFRVPILPGCCLAMKRTVFEDTGGYDEGLRTRGGVDAETGIRFWLLGYENWIVPAARVWHKFREHSPCRIPHSDVIHNRLRTAMVHFNPWRLSGVLRAIGKDPSSGPGLLAAISGNIADRRRALLAARVHDDEWLLRKFQIQW